MLPPGVRLVEQVNTDLFAPETLEAGDFPGPGFLGRAGLLLTAAGLVAGVAVNNFIGIF